MSTASATASASAVASPTAAGFAALGLDPALCQALAAEGYQNPTPIQAQAIQPGLAGRDILGCAQTGTGKTAAFALPILQRLAADPLPANPGRSPRALIVVPTRELAAQVADSIKAYGKNLRLAHTVVFGGVGQHPQEQALRRGLDILIATPGRLLDLIQQRVARLDKVQILVLDEADRMLDMGFAPDVKRIVAQVPTKRQTLLFSATMPDEVRSLAESLLKDPARIAVAPVAATADTVQQEVFFVARNDKQPLLQHLLKEPGMDRVLVFARTKRGADRVAKNLNQAGFGAEAIHGDKSQGARTKALANFKNGKARVLVASDIAARGIDVDEVSHVINLDVPHEPETYVHRIGRTGRAGARGQAWTFCDGEERADLRAIEKLIRKPVPVRAEHPFVDRNPAANAALAQQQRGPQQRRGGRPPGGRSQQGGRPAQHSQRHHDDRRPAGTGEAPRADAGSRQPVVQEVPFRRNVEGGERRLPRRTGR